MHRICLLLFLKDSFFITFVFKTARNFFSRHLSGTDAQKCAKKISRMNCKTWNYWTLMFFSLKYYTSDWEMWYYIYYRFLHCCRSLRVLQEFCLNDLDFNFQAKIFAMKKMSNGVGIDFVLGMIAILTHPCASRGKVMYQRYVV